jgi:hypothetical protein
MEAETGVWAYCVARDDHPMTDARASVHPSGAPVWLRHGRLALLHSLVPLAEFGAEPLRDNLNDLAWLERVARAHEAVIEDAFEGGTVVPLRLATMFTGEAAARRMLDERSVELLAALHVLEGREEWAVKVLVDPERMAGEPPDPAAAGSGTAYLLQRRDERRRKEEAGDRAAALADDVHRRLQEQAVATRLRPAQNRELSGYEGEMVLNGAYLVERGPAGGIDALVGELAERLTPSGARIELGGPFPPYSFVPEGS